MLFFARLLRGAAGGDSLAIPFQKAVDINSRTPKDSLLLDLS